MGLVARYGGAGGTGFRWGLARAGLLRGGGAALAAFSALIYSAARAAAALRSRALWRSRRCPGFEAVRGPRRGSAAEHFTSSAGRRRPQRGRPRARSAQAFRLLRSAWRFPWPMSQRSRMKRRRVSCSPSRTPFSWPPLSRCCLPRLGRLQTRSWWRPRAPSSARCNVESWKGVVIGRVPGLDAAAFAEAAAAARLQVLRSGCARQDLPGELRAKLKPST
jgi:hypothetical protein